MHMYEFDAIGTHWWLENLDGGTFSEDIKQSLEQYTTEFDRRYSRFRDDSLIAQLAFTGRLERPPQEMLDMIDFVYEMHAITKGVFTPLVGNHLQALGYGRITLEKPSNTNKTPNKLKKFNLSSLGEHLDEIVRWNTNVVTVPKGCVLDFGGFGKGWLIDEYVKIIQKYGVMRFIVNGGGDLYCQSDRPIKFALEDPHDSTKILGSIDIQRGALAASSILKRSWETSKGKQHHIIDPKTRKPSNSTVVASFVTAKTALVADALATVLIIRPELEGALQQRYNAKVELVYA